jgi:hypothetical protein
MSDQSNLVCEELKTGPVLRRKCTDIVFLILFVLHLFALTILGVTASVTSDSTKLTAGQDSQGDFCGLKKSSSGRSDSLQDYKYLLYTINSDISFEWFASMIKPEG